MTDNTGITLNIHNKEPGLGDNTIDNINQTETAIYATNNLPTKSELDNAGFGQASAPRANYGIPIFDNSIIQEIIIMLKNHQLLFIKIWKEQFLPNNIHNSL